MDSIPLPQQPSPLKFLVVDDHELTRNDIVRILREHYPTGSIQTASNATDALNLIKGEKPDLAILDVSLPLDSQATESANFKVGIDLIKNLMNEAPTINITAISGEPKYLEVIKEKIYNHEGGFTIYHKGLSSEDLLARIKGAMEGYTYTPGLKGRRIFEFKPVWLEVLSLAWEGYQDEDIAKKIYKSRETVRKYWSKIYNEFTMYDETVDFYGKNINKRALCLRLAIKYGIITPT